MKGRRFNAGRALPLIAILATLLVAAGCGSSGSSSGSEITVQTGSLSKAEFIDKANAICEKARAELSAEFWRFLKAQRSPGKKPQSQQEMLTEMLDSILDPNVQREIRQISTLGAPEDFAPEVAAFLNALQEQLDRAHENPVALNSTPYPFKAAEDAAKRAGIDGCATTT